jgi:hypothetical protein
VKRLLLGIALAWVSVAGLSGSPEGQRVWFKFSKAFINANYTSGEALGTVKAQTWGAAKEPHSTKCGGIDGELHVGALESGVSIAASNRQSRARRPPTIRAGASCSSYRMRSQARAGDAHEASGQDSHV